MVMKGVEVHISADGVVLCAPEGLTPLVCTLWGSGKSVCSDCPIKKVAQWQRD